MNARQLEKRLGVSRAKPAPRKSMLEIVLDAFFSKTVWEFNPLQFVMSSVPALVAALIIAVIVSILGGLTGFAQGMNVAVTVIVGILGLVIFGWFRTLTATTPKKKLTKAEKRAIVRSYQLR